MINRVQLDRLHYYLRTSNELSSINLCILYKQAANIQDLLMLNLLVRARRIAQFLIQTVTKQINLLFKNKYSWQSYPTSKMEWQPSTAVAPAAMPTVGPRLFQSWAKAYSFVSDACKSMSSIVRDVRRAQKAIRPTSTPRPVQIRRSLQVHAAAVAEDQQQQVIEDHDVVEPLTERKRKAPEEPEDYIKNSMRVFKRRQVAQPHRDYSPWSVEQWAKENATIQEGHSKIHSIPLSPSASISNDENKYIPRTERESSISPLRKNHYRNRWSPYKRDTRKTPIPERVTLARPITGVPEFLWLEEDEDMADTPAPPSSTSRKKEKASSDTSDQPEITLIKSSPLQRDTRQLTPPGSDDDSKSVTSSNMFDEEADIEYRAFLRADPGSTNEDGFKLPINGWTSPETQAYNKLHKQKLLREAAIAQQTPSRPPKTEYRSPFESDEGSEEETASVKSEEVSNQEDVPDKDSIGAEVAVEVQITDDSTKEEVDVKKEIVPETPLKELRISTNTAKVRTPKASIFDTVKTDRRTRRQALLEEREAEKQRDEYKLVELGKEWDQKVRHAVRNGTADERYRPEDFSRVVPEYSTNPRGSKWLNDAVINDYITMLAKHGCRDDRPTQKVPTVASLSSFFYQKMSDPANAPKRWTKKIAGAALFECDLVLLPINAHAHWTLCTILPKQRKVVMYNSMGYGSNAQHARTVLNYLKFHLQEHWIEEEWSVDSKGVSPQQANTDDCGVFTCTTARQIVLGQMEKNPYESGIMPIARKRMIAELLNQGLLKASES